MVKKLKREKKSNFGKEKSKSGYKRSEKII